MKDELRSIITAGMSSRQVQGALIMAWRAGLTVHVLWACGWLGMIGAGNGFAHADEATENRKENLQAAILDLKIKQCEAIAAQKSARTYTILLNQYIEKYYKIAGKNPEIPGCLEIN